MTNQSKLNDPRFWKKWRESGAVGTIEEADERARGELTRPNSFPHYSVDRGTFTFIGPMKSRYFTSESTARNYFLRDIKGSGQGPHVQLVIWENERVGRILSDRYQK
jgi:hypothetical protein